jgi:hypothetical protein
MELVKSGILKLLEAEDMPDTIQLSVQRAEKILGIKN